jgi:hypothetical protein
MLIRALVKCDGPNCQREIDSNIHAGTWLTLKFGQLFGNGIGNQYRPDAHYCSYFCLADSLFFTEK